MAHYSTGGDSVTVRPEIGAFLGRCDRFSETSQTACFTRGKPEMLARCHNFSREIRGSMNRRFHDQSNSNPTPDKRIDEAPRPKRRLAAASDLQRGGGALRGGRDGR